MSHTDSSDPASVHLGNTHIQGSTEQKISIVICNYNYGRFLAACVGSVTEQTRPANELIVVDDGSTDESRKILQALSGIDRLILQENGGQRAAINAGYAACTGDIVIFLDADDVLANDALACIEAMWRPETSKLHFPMQLIDIHGNDLGRSIPRVLARGDLSESFRQGRIFGSSPGSGNAYARGTLERLMPLPIDARDRHCADFFLIYGSSLLGEITAIDRPLASYRLHANANTIYFGNARLDPDHASWERRGTELRSWLRERTGAEVLPPDFGRDFSVQKLRYAGTLLSIDGYLRRLMAAPSALRRLLPSIFALAGAGFAYRAGLVMWALLVAVLPYRQAHTAARYVCNPAARSARN